MPKTTVTIAVEDGGVPTTVLGPDDPSGVPALVVIPSIFGPATDLLERLSEFEASALIVAPDPFWRDGHGVVPYADRETAFPRLKENDFEQSVTDIDAVVDWARTHGNGKVVGLGICFGGPFVVRLAGEGRLDGGVAWHGTRMEQHLNGAARATCPMRFHFGDADPVTPPEVIEQIREAYASHPDLAIAIHPGATHGFSHDGPAYDETACRAGLDAVQELVEGLR